MLFRVLTDSTMTRISGCNMSIISKVDEHRSSSIEYDTNQSTKIGNR